MSEPTEEELAELRRVNSQCTLLWNMVHLRQNFVGQIPIKGKNVFSYQGDISHFPNAAINPKSTAAFMNATNDELSLLQPTLRFFIEETWGDHPVYFSDFVLGEKMVEYAGLREQGSLDRITSPSSVIGTNVGIKSFSWNFDNKHEGDRVVKANLSLHFGSLIDLLNDTYLDFIHLNVNQKPADLAPPPEEKGSRIKWLDKRIQARKQALQGGTRPNLPGEPNCKQDSDAPFRKLKVVVGYAVPDNIDNGIFTDGFIEAVRDSERTLVLNLTKYDLNFNEDGSVGLDIEYVASIDALFLSPKTDILQGLALAKPPDLQFARVAQGNHFWKFWAEDREDVLLPEGYIKARYDAASSAGWPLKLKPSEYASGLVYKFFNAAKDEDNAFEVSLQGVKNELDYLHEAIELENLKLGKKKGEMKNVAAEKIKKLERHLEEAETIYDEVKLFHRTARYGSFMDAIVYSGKVFVARSSLIDVNRAAKERVAEGEGDESDEAAAEEAPRSAIINASPPTLKEINTFRERMKAAVEADKYRKSDKTIEEYIEKGGFLDPLSQASHEGSKRSVPIFYMRLADMVDVAMRNAGMPDDTSIMFGSWAPSLLGMGNVSYSKGYEPVYSLGDIPISLDYFGSWWLEHVINAEKETYTFRRFLDDLLNTLVKPAVNYLCFNPKTNLKIGFTNVTSTLSPSQVRTYNKLLPGPDGDGKASILIKQTLNMLRESTSQLNFNDRTYNYVLIYGLQADAKLIGNRKEDEERGIYHLVVGSDTGVAKSFSFSEKSMPQIRAMNIEDASKGSTAGALIIPQDCNVQVVGNSYFQNGMRVYINADMGLGTEAARSLRLGGYYIIYKVENSVGPGEFKSTIHCKYEQAPGGSGKS